MKKRITGRDDLTSPLGPDAARFLKGQAFGDVWPGPASPALQHRDARTHALRTLREFVSLLRFRRTGDTPDGAPIGFQVPKKDIHVYQPDDVQNHAPRPGIGFLPGRATHESYGLGPPEVLEDTADKFGSGLVLVRRSDHVETVPIEIFVAKAPERDGIVAGLKEAFQLDDRSQALRLVCRNYFDIVACFRLDESENIDDAAGTDNRRRAHLYMALQVPEVALVRYRRLLVLPDVEVMRIGFEDTSVESFPEFFSQFDQVIAGAGNDVIAGLGNNVILGVPIVLPEFVVAGLDNVIAGTGNRVSVNAVPTPPPPTTFFVSAGPDSVIAGAGNSVTVRGSPATDVVHVGADNVIAGAGNLVTVHTLPPLPIHVIATPDNIVAGPDQVVAGLG